MQLNVVEGNRTGVDFHWMMRASTTMIWRSLKLELPGWESTTQTLCSGVVIWHSLFTLNPLTRHRRALKAWDSLLWTEKLQ